MRAPQERFVEGSTVGAVVPKPDEGIDRNRLAAFRLAEAVREALEGDFLEEDQERFLEDLDRRLL